MMRRVTAAELRDLWFQENAIGLQLDEANNRKVVTLADGSSYYCDLDDPEASK